MAPCHACSHVTLEGQDVRFSSSIRHDHDRKKMCNGVTTSSCGRQGELDLSVKTPFLHHVRHAAMYLRMERTPGPVHITAMCMRNA